MPTTDDDHTTTAAHAQGLEDAPAASPATDDDPTLRVGASVVIDPPIDSSLGAFVRLAGTTGTVTAVTERDGQRIVRVRLPDGGEVDIPADGVVSAEDV